MTEGSSSARATMWRLLRPRWKALSALSVTSLLGGFVEAAFLVALTRVALAVSDGSDSVDVGLDDPLSVRAVLILAIVAVVVRLALAIASAWQITRLSAHLTAEIRRNLSRAFLSASWSVQHDQRTGKLQELLTTFAGQGAVLVQNTSMSINAGFNILALFLSTLLIDATSAIILVAVVAFLGLLLRPLRRTIRHRAGDNRDTGVEFATGLSEVSQLGMEMHVFGVQRQTRRRVDRLIERNRRTRQRLRFTQALVPALYTAMTYVAIVVTIGTIAAIGSSEDVPALGAVALIMLRSLGYAQTMQRTSANVLGTLPFLDGLDDEIEALRGSAAPTGHLVPERFGTIEFEHVRFDYEPGTPVLHDITLQIEPHEVIGIVGPSGSGKSTLVQLLLGLRSPSDGRVTVDDIDVDDIRRDYWNRRVTFVPQEAHLFAGTVEENIRFLRDDVTPDEIVRAAQLAQLHDEIVSWPDGYERQVGEQGGQLSGGQKQRLVIARALVERPSLLVLDEPTSALDVRSEALIRSTLDTLRSEMTIVIIAHRLSTLDICDRIMVIQDGRLRAFDTPTKLSESSSFYREALELSGLS